MCETLGKTLLHPVSLGSVCSYELNGNIILARLLGVIPIQKIHLADIHYLRLATHDELSAVFLLFNWPRFLPHRRSCRPVYVLQTKTRRRIFLNLAGYAHFRLRNAIGQIHESPLQRVAA